MNLRCLPEARTGMRQGQQRPLEIRLLLLGQHAVEPGVYQILYVPLLQNRHPFCICRSTQPLNSARDRESNTDTPLTLSDRCSAIAAGFSAS